MQIVPADTVISWLAKMRDYYKVPDVLLFDETISAFDILFLALSSNAFKAYEHKLEEQLAKQNKK